VIWINILSAENSTICGGRTMKRNVYLTTALAGLSTVAGLFLAANARTAAHEKNAYIPDAVPYGPAPAFVAPGAQLAVLEGNPGATSRDFTVRL
jgi:hypothetical protein